jgi:radical SAM-linked protein
MPALPRLLVMVRDKVRIRFSKSGDLRMISHHDLMRCFERMLRRAAIPYHATQGFNPKPRLIFAMPLPLGIVGCNEIAELELDEELSPQEVQRRLTAEAPDGLQILDSQKISPRTAAHVRGVRYQLPIPAERESGLPERIIALMASTECMVERQRPRFRRFDLRPYLSDLRLEGCQLVMDLRVTPKGTARPDEVLTVLALDDLLQTGTVIERVQIDITPETIAVELPALAVCGTP